jgi:hypothetical protein
MRKILELEKEFTGKGEMKGWKFKQIMQYDKAYIYQIILGSCVYYEVFKKKAKSNSIKYCYPTSKAFDIWTWSRNTLEKAIGKFNELNQ